MQKNPLRPSRLAVAMALAGCPAWLMATDFTVTDPGDAGPGTLRDIINQANADLDSPHNIYFDLPPETTITLTSGDILIERSMSLHGPGADQLTISGNSNGRIFNVESSSLVNAVISGMTLTEGFLDNFAYDFSGGAVRARGNFIHLVVRDSIITNNEAANNRGGGIAGMTGADITCERSIVSNNQASSGGGISASGGTLSLDECDVMGNEAGFGGGIIMINGDLQIQDSEISGNTGTSEAGGIYVYGTATYFDIYTASLTGDNATMSNNDTGGSGGGIRTSLADITLTESVLSNNEAGFRGGAIYSRGDFAYIPHPGKVDLHETTISANNSQRGGGLYLRFGRLSIEESILSGNEAEEFGGAFHAEDSRVQLNDCEIVGNKADQSAGASIVNNWTDSSILACRFHQQETENAGMLHISGGESMLIADTLIDHNTALEWPGLVILNQDIELSNVTIAHNQALTKSVDAASSLWLEGTITYLDNSTIAFNHAATTGAQAPGAVTALHSMVNMRSTLVALNTDATSDADGGQLRRTGSSVLNGEHNLLSHASEWLFDGTNTENLVVADPAIDELSERGGRWPVIALQPGSPARNAGINPRDLDYDMRGVGFDRVVGSAADIGAFELQPFEISDLIFHSRFE